MAVDTIRRLAADILRVGENRIRFDSEKMGEVRNAMTRNDVRDLIGKKVIRVLPKQGRRKKEKREKRGRGSRKGSEGIGSKKAWMVHVRSQRRLLKTLVGQGVLEKKSKRPVYMKIKGNAFRNKKAMLTYMKDNSLIPKDFELPKKEKKGEQK